MNNQLNDLKSIRLTQTVKKGGCAAKLPAGELRKFLSSANLNKPKDLLVGTDLMDDACVWDLHDGRCLIQTVDFFTPIVDDFYEFGAIAAANAISDVYAMGGKPVTALSVLAYPSAALPMEGLEPLMRGAIDKIQESGAVLAGGHSIDDETLKLGFSVSGFANKNSIWTNAGAKVGDVLILTKAIGTGVATSAIKTGKIDRKHADDVVNSMMQLNRAVDFIDVNDVHAATDITGFGLLGHSLQVARASQVSIQFDFNSIPKFSLALELMQQGVRNRAHTTNMQYVKDHVDFGSLKDFEKDLMCDAQTSGGILMAVPEGKANSTLEKLKGQFPMSCVIGRVEEMSSGQTVKF